MNPSLPAVEPARQLHSGGLFSDASQKGADALAARRGVTPPPLPFGGGVLVRLFRTPGATGSGFGCRVAPPVPPAARPAVVGPTRQRRRPSHRSPQCTAAAIPPPLSPLSS